MVTLKCFKTSWLKKLEKKLDLYDIGLCIAERIANSGAPTFALYYYPKYRGNQGFLIPVDDMIDMPMWAIREFLENAVRGKKKLEKEGEWTGFYIDDLIKAARIGHEMEEAIL